MSYVVSIVRPTPIGDAELEQFAADSAEFDLDRGTDAAVLSWRNPHSETVEFFVLTDGALEITTPSESGLATAQHIADKLGASVVGEEGEDLTNADKTSNAASSGCGPMTATLLMVGSLLAAYWLLA